MFYCNILMIFFKLKIILLIKSLMWNALLTLKDNFVKIYNSIYKKSEGFNYYFWMPRVIATNIYYCYSYSFPSPTFTNCNDYTATHNSTPTTCAITFKRILLLITIALLLFFIVISIF